MLFSSHLVTVGMLKGLCKDKYGTKETDICRVFVTRKDLCDQEDFIVRPDDCIKISVVRGGELVCYKHGSALDVLRIWSVLATKTEIPACPRCSKL